MSYAAEEISVQSGAPIEFYDFAQGSSEWHYTSMESGYTDDSQSPSVVYTSASIERSAIASSEEQVRNSLSLIVPRTFAIADLFIASPPSETITVTVRRMHRPEIFDIATIWVGRVINCAFEGARAILTCEPITVSLKRTGLRRLYGKSCAYALYGQGCGVDKTAFDHATTVDSISGSVLSVATVNVSYDYAGGFVEWVNGDGITERRFITGATGTDLTLMMPFQSISVTDAVTIYPGCDHTLTTCNATFGNAVNYGGFPWFPPRNPFAGTPVV